MSNKTLAALLIAVMPMILACANTASAANRAAQAPRQASEDMDDEDADDDASAGEQPCVSNADGKPGKNNSDRKSVV